MGMKIECGKENLKPGNIYQYLKYKLNFRKEHPNYFDADGLLCFIGPQGSGKTLSAVNYTYKLLDMYQNAKLCTNILLKDYPIVTFEDFKDKYSYLMKLLEQRHIEEDIINEVMYSHYLRQNKVFPFNDNDDFQKYSNGEEGVIFFVDEIQLYLNSLESKNINMDTMTQISQQRKQRKHIIGTSQVFGRMAKPLREQFSNVVVCKNYFGFFQSNSLVDRDSLDTESSSDTQIAGKIKKKFLWFHHPQMYKRYDTYYVIQKGKFTSGENQKEGVYDVGRIKLSIDH